MNPHALLRDVAHEYMHRERRKNEALARGDSESYEHWKSRQQEIEQNVEVRELNGSWR